MTTTFCPGCGAEYENRLAVCSDCGILLAPDDALVFEMEGWEPGERDALSKLLHAESIPHRWDGDDLLVPEEHEERVDEVMDRLEFPDALEAAEDGPDGPDDEAVYSVMSNLFVAADRVAGQRVHDVDVAGELVTASAAASAIPPPYGVDPVSWARVQEMAESLVATIEGQAGDEVVAQDAATLRDLLRRFV